MRSKGRIWMLLVLVAMAPLAAYADKKSELDQKGKAAAAAGNVFEAKNAYCELADLDPNYPQAKMMCSVMTKEADKEQARCESRFSDAMQDINQSKFDDAEQKLRNVKAGCKRYDEAQQYVKVKIPQMKTEGDRDKLAAQKLQEAKQGYAKNDFTGAKAALSQIPGSSSKAGEAQDLLNKIKQYEQAMAEGDRLLNGKNYGAARNSYQEAAKLKADGPGDPTGKIQKAVDAEKVSIALVDEQKRKEEETRKEAERRAKKPTLALQVSPNSGQAALTVNAKANPTEGGTKLIGTLIQWGDGSVTNDATGSHVYKNAGTYDVVAWVTDEAGNKVSQIQTVRVIEAAVKQIAPEVDVAQTLAEARAAKAKGNISLARGKYMKVLTADKTNAEAIAALDELSKQAATTPAQPTPEPQTPGVISDSDQLLAKGITEYYTGNFDDAYSDLKDYLKFKGEKVGLANFYMGALKATQYHLGGATESSLLDAATNAFRVAKKTPNFKPPTKYISPKILDMYNNAGM